ncbi:sigma-54 interaction domain-containing protein [Pseudomonas oryzihabitans]|uniref:sigma-54 interaction domain-containing protein n=1 Tax=Pseudomonas oryzihabitans TaxID=47885 RepID=UPI00285B1E35|nr:sigma 54-interacting transcriptional regulator [Pseudomonas psychrotolerans]MDR6676925.1 sigma-54-dependent transcriptional regulator [Pseudomonas psychrotolerans]
MTLPATPDNALPLFIELGQCEDTAQLALGLVEGIRLLASLDLVQYYRLDATHTQLVLLAQGLDGRSALSGTTLPLEQESLLHYCLTQNRSLHLRELDPLLHATAFLPGEGWRSLGCLPLSDPAGQVEGLLVQASRTRRDLEAHAEILAPLGRFALAQSQLLERAQALPMIQGPAQPATASTPADGFGMLGDGGAMRQVHRLIGKVLHTPITVLLTGETGTGKELVARAIHERGSRRTRPFVVQNCAALPEHLLESELFGYRKGAFTGAERDRAGLFDAANGGTLFLDEIGDMPLTLQAKLLRVLQEGEVRPLGSAETHKVDVRIVAATHRNLLRLVEQGTFREDLYYRLTHFPIQLPPLRERGEDLPLLARHFADQACACLQRSRCRWSSAALDLLAGHAFPGNVRELKGLVERAVLLCDGNELLPEHFAIRPTTLATATSSLTLRERLDQLERGLLVDCLRKNRGNQTQAAQELGLPRRTLLYRLQRLSIRSSDLQLS